MEYRIKEVAELSGTTVRTLHHYHDIGLLVPDRITEAGYRLYSESSLMTLRQILFLRELDFPLKQIRALLKQSDFDEVALYRKQRRLLQLKIQRLNGILDALDQAIIQRGGMIPVAQIFKPFNKEEIETMQEQYADELRSKYDHDVVEACNNKVANYDDEKWKEVQIRMGELIQTLADCMDHPPSCPAAQQAIHQYRMHITDSFYDCTPDILKGLGQLYICDERFTQFFEQCRKGLAQYVKEVIDVYCENQ